MIKKIIPLLGLALGFAVAGQAHAAVVQVAGTQNISTTNCPALSNNITAQMSATVIGGYNCDATTFVAATCSTKGTLKLQSVNCQYNADGSQKVGYENGCPADNNAAIAAQAADANNAWPKTSPINSRLGYVGGSDGGQVAAAAMGIDCDLTSLTELTPDSYLDSGASTSTP